MTTHKEIQRAASDYPGLTIPDNASFAQQEPLVLPAHTPVKHARFEYANTLQFATTASPVTFEIRTDTHTVERTELTNTTIAELLAEHSKHRTNYLLRTLLDPNPITAVTPDATAATLIENYDSLYDFYLDFTADELPGSIDKQYFARASTTCSQHYRDDENTYYATPFTCPACNHTQKQMHKVKPGSYLNNAREDLSPYLCCANCPNTTIPETHMLTPTEILTSN